jgi:hypothetical protein
LSIPQGFNEVQQRIETWLKDEGFEYSQIADEGTRKTLFTYLVSRTGTKWIVFQPSDKKDSVCVYARLLFTDEQSRLFGKKTQIERNEILSEMRFKLASLDVEFTFENGQMPRAIRFDHPIYYDALTKDRFFKAIGTIYKALKIASWAFAQSL